MFLRPKQDLERHRTKEERSEEEEIKRHTLSKVLLKAPNRKMSTLQVAPESTKTLDQNRAL